MEIYTLKDLFSDNKHDTATMKTVITKDEQKKIVEKYEVRFPTEVCRIVQYALQHDDEKVKAYTRKLSDYYRNELKEEGIADTLLAYIGDIELPMAVME